MTVIPLMLRRSAAFKASDRTVFGYIIYKTVEFFLCPPLVPTTP
jgi:hypothetical protein